MDINIKTIESLYKDKKYTVKEVADEIGLTFWKVYDIMRKNDILRRNSSETNYVRYDRYKPKFYVKKNINIKDEYLKIAGVMLYWAEGFKGGGVDFANSDPEMIRLFLAFLRKICGVDESRLRIYLYTYEGQDVEALKKFWTDVTQIPYTQFNKPYVRRANANSSGRKMHNGLIHVRYYDKKLSQTILGWIKEYISSFK